MRHLISASAAIVLAIAILSQFLIAGSTARAGKPLPNNAESDNPFNDNGLDDLFRDNTDINPFAAEDVEDDLFGDAPAKPADNKLDEEADPFADGDGGTKSDGQADDESLKVQNARKIIEMLDERCKQIDFIDTSLQDAIQIIREQNDNMNVVLDEASLDLAGIDSETPITLNLNDVSLRSALRLMLRGLDLTFEVRDEVLLVTSIEESEMLLSAVVTPVHDMLNKENPIASANSLIKSITNAATPDSWECVGGPATISYYQGNLIVAHTQQGHEAVAELLQKLHVGIQAAGGPVYPEQSSDDAPPTKQPAAPGGGGTF